MKTIRWDGRWRPEGATHHYGRRFPEVGETVAYEYRAWEVTHFRLDDFAEDEMERARLYKPEARERLRPYRVSLRRVYGEKHHRENSRQEIALAVFAFTHWSFDTYDEGRVPLCSCCQNPWPCLVSVAKEQSEEEAKRLDKRLARAGVGICYACGEVITSRQKSAEYGSGNVDLPGYPTPRFHLRESCRYERVGYMDRVMKAQGDEVVTGTVDEGMF